MYKGGAFIWGGPLIEEGHLLENICYLINT